WTTLSNYFNDVMPGDYASAAEADEFHGDYLTERCPTEIYTYETQEAQTRPGLGGERPISMFARHVRARRRLDTAWTLAALQHSLGGSLPAVESGDFLTHLAHLEDGLESDETLLEKELTQVQEQIAEALA